MVPDATFDLYETHAYVVDESIDGLKLSAVAGLASVAGCAPLILGAVFNAGNEALAVATFTASLGTLTGIFALKTGKSCLRDYRKTREEMLAMEQQYPELKKFSPFKEATPPCA